MNENEIRKIVREEMDKNFRSGQPKIPPHIHNGVDNLKIPSTSVVPSTSAIGQISFARETTYTLYFNSQNPTRIDVNGFAENAGTTIYGLIVGVALLKPSYYFQPVNNSSVKTGGKSYPILGAVSPSDTPTLAQNCSSLLIDQSSLSNTFPTLNQFRSVFVDSVSGVVASGYFNNLTMKSVDLVIEVLASGWKVDLNVAIS